MPETAAAAPPQSETSESPKTPETPTSKTTAKRRAPRKKKRLRGNVFKRLRKDAEKTVRENTLKICKALLKQTIQGDVKCAKLLFSLLEKNPNEATPQKIRDFASILSGPLTWDPNNPEGLPEDEDDEPADDSAESAPIPSAAVEPVPVFTNVPPDPAPMPLATEPQASQAFASLAAASPTIKLILHKCSEPAGSYGSNETSPHSLAPPMRVSLIPEPPLSST